MSAASQRRLADALALAVCTVFIATLAAIWLAHDLRGDGAATWAGVVGGGMLLMILLVALLGCAMSARPGEEDPTVVRVGSKVAFADPVTGRKASYRILPDEQAHAPDALPESSPVAQALLGARPRQSVDVVERTLIVDAVDEHPAR